MVWIVAAIILSILVIVLVIYIAAVKAELSRMADRVAFVNGNDTNMQLYTQIKLKELDKLAIQVNALISGQKNESIAIRRAEREFRQAITNLSHDLRTPLTSAAGYIQMLKSDKTPPAKREEYLDTIERRLESLRGMLDSLFEYARLQSGEYTLDMQKTDVFGVLCDVIATYYDDINSNGIIPEIKLERESCPIYADRNALKRIFENLISNSLKHGNGDLGIEAAIQGGTVEILFRNQAGDLTEEDAAQLLDRFFTADKSRSSKSTGLGLAIVKELVKNTGGEIAIFLKDSCLNISLRYKAL